MDLSKDRALRPDQAALILNTSKRTIYRLVEEGNFTTFKLRGSLRIMERSVYKYINRQIERQILDN